MANRPRRPKSEGTISATNGTPGEGSPDRGTSADLTASPADGTDPSSTGAEPALADPAPTDISGAPTTPAGERVLPAREDQPAADGDAIRRAQAGGEEPGEAAGADPSPTETFAAEEGLAAKAGEPPRRHLGEFEDDETVGAAEATASRPRPVTDAYAGGSERPITADHPAAAGTSTGSLVGAGLAGAVIALLGGSLLVYAGLVPGMGTAQTSAQYASAGDLEGVSSEVAGLRAAVEQLQSADAAGGSGGFASASDLGALSDRLTALEQSGDQLAPAPSEPSGPVVDEEARTNVAAAQQAADAAQATAGEAQSLAGEVRTQATEIDERVSGFEERLAGIEAAQAQARVALAAAGLKAAIDRGGAFAPELEGFAEAGGAPEAVETLRAFAADGIPTERQLVEEWPEAEGAIRQALARPDENAGVGDQILAGLSSLVTVRSSGEAAAEGTGSEAVIARMRAAIESGDLGAWRSEWDTLDPAAREASQTFADRVDARRQASSIVDSALGSAGEATPANAG